MAKLVNEVMNPELFALRPTDRSDDAIGYLLALDISAAPVVGEGGKPLGFFSLKDALRNGSCDQVEDCMTRSVQTVFESSTVEEAARILAAGDLHHAPVVTDEGHVVGVASAVDLLKALLGLPVTHPSAFPHVDRKTGLSWTDDMELDVSSAERAPNGQGLLVLVAGGAGRREQVVWVEPCNNVRTRVFELVSVPQTETPLLAKILERDHVRFRAAAVPDPGELRKAVQLLAKESQSWMVPKGASDGE